MPESKAQPRVLTSVERKRLAAAPPGTCEGCGCKLSAYRKKVPFGSRKGEWEFLCAACQRTHMVDLVGSKYARQPGMMHGPVTDKPYRERVPIPPRKERTMATAVAPVKKELALPRRKWHREIAPALEDLGFHFLGLDGSQHAIFQHKSAGQVRLAQSPSGPLDIQKKQAIARARRMIAIYESEAQTFLIHLRDLFQVLPHEVKQIRVNLSDEAKAWIKHAHSKETPHNLTALLRDSPYIELTGTNKGKGKSEYLLWGSDALASSAEKDVVDRGDVIDAALAEVAKQKWMEDLAAKGGAVAWLAEYLRDGKAHLVNDVLEAAEKSHLTEYALRDASKALGIIVEREAKYQGKGLWRLPAPPDLAKESPANGKTTTAERVTKPPEKVAREALNAAAIRSHIISAAADGDLGDSFGTAEVWQWFQDKGYTLPSYTSDGNRPGQTAVSQNLGLLRQEGRLVAEKENGRSYRFSLKKAREQPVPMPTKPPLVKPLNELTEEEHGQKLDAEIAAVKELMEPEEVPYGRVARTGSLAEQIVELEQRAARVDEAEAKVSLLSEELAKAEAKIAECMTALSDTQTTVRELRSLV